ncbi:MAG: hypothetical protein ABIZ52_07295 [Candidatus Limnocylindrales bacterium]
MQHRTVRVSVSAGLVLAAMLSTAVNAQGPERIRDAYTDRFHDDFILELCGIDTWTTIKERWTLKIWPDGSQTFQVTRTFTPDDPRIPIEKGAGTGYFAPDGTQTKVIGKPIQLFYQDRGLKLIDAGYIEWGDPIIEHGRHPFLDADLAELYCPPEA